MIKYSIKAENFTLSLFTLPLRVAPLILIPLVLITLTACSVKPWVKPYERDKLADPLMSGESNPLDDGYMKHAFNSREAARGAEGGTGGGCGCN